MRKVEKLEAKVVSWGFFELNIGEMMSQVRGHVCSVFLIGEVSV